MAFNLPVFFVFISTLVSLSNGSGSEEYSKCSSPTSCGRVKDIQYPFSLQDNRFCGSGDSWSQLSCNSSSDYPAILNTFKVHRINTSNHTIVLSQDRNGTCRSLESSHSNYFSDLKKFFKVGANVGEITLFLGCPGRSTNLTSRSALFSCSSIDVNESVYYLDKPGEVGSKCQKNATFLVSRRALDEFISTNGSGRTLDSVLEEEFEMQYIVPNSTACSACRQSSRGVCGSSVDTPSEFACYKPDQDNSEHFSPILGFGNYFFFFNLVEYGCYRSMVKISHHDTLAIIFVVLAVSTVAVVSVIFIIFCRRKKIKKFCLMLWNGKATIEHQKIEAHLKLHEPLAPRRYTYANIRKMTNSFKEKLGEGGYAEVYKGILSDGQIVAVKLLKQSKGTSGEEFINEVASMGRTNHVNVLRLLGFCFEGYHKALVFEFMPKGSLDKFTHHCNNCHQHHHQPLPLSTIFDIAVGIAKGLEYLHRGCNTRIVHFDIKPHNILLDEELCPKISDFGLARQCQQKESTISMLEARGTIGYIAPEVFCRNFGGVSHKSDVYSYGMMVLDLACGKRGGDNHVYRSEESSESSFSDWIYQRVEVGDEIEVNGVMNEEERELQRKMILVSFWCIQAYPSQRPSISNVVEMLEGSVELIQMPPKPFLSSPPTLAFTSSISGVTSSNESMH